jgi:hypothetical protein
MSTTGGHITPLRPGMGEASADGDEAAGPMVPLARLDYAGALVVVEGVDGSGKSTQIQLLRQHLQEQGADVLFTEWNSSTLTHEAIRAGKKRLWLGPQSFALLHAADFAHRFERQILPALSAGRIVPEYGLRVVDANRPVAPQHDEVRELVAPILRRHLELKNRRRGLPRWEVARAS